MVCRKDPPTSIHISWPRSNSKTFIHSINSNLSSCASRRVSEHIIAWRVPAADPDGGQRSFALHHSPQTGLELGRDGTVQGADETLQLSTSAGVPASPYLRKSDRLCSQHKAR